MNEWKKDPEKYIYVDDFLESKCASIKKVVELDPYLSFSLICIGIEFIGRCLDEKRGFKYYGSAITNQQFQLAITTYFEKYSHLGIQKNLRHKMVHMWLPGENFWLRDKSCATKEEHLKPKDIDGKIYTVLVVDFLFDDFEKAVKDVVSKIRAGDFTNPKMRHALLKVS